ncbi:MAG: hypothetical protein AAEC03_09825, partial [Synechococcus sp.]
MSRYSDKGVRWIKPIVLNYELYNMSIDPGENSDQGQTNAVGDSMKMGHCSVTNNLNCLEPLPARLSMRNSQASEADAGMTRGSVAQR